MNYGDGQTQGYTFDPMGNRLTKTDSLNPTETYVSNAANMLVTRNGLGYAHGKTAATLIPPAFGLAGVNQHTWTGSWGTPSRCHC